MKRRIVKTVDYVQLQNAVAVAMIASLASFIAGMAIGVTLAQFHI